MDGQRLPKPSRTLGIENLSIQTEPKTPSQQTKGHMSQAGITRQITQLGRPLAV
jgi:hypothetical protein